MSSRLEEVKPWLQELFDVLDGYEDLKEAESYFHEAELDVTPDSTTTWNDMVEDMEKQAPGTRDLVNRYMAGRVLKDHSQGSYFSLSKTEANPDVLEDFNTRNELIKGVEKIKISGRYEEIENKVKDYNEIRTDLNARDKTLTNEILHRMETLKDEQGWFPNIKRGSIVHTPAAILAKYSIQGLLGWTDWFRDEELGKYENIFLNLGEDMGFEGDLIKRKQNELRSLRKHKEDITMDWESGTGKIVKKLKEDEERIIALDRKINEKTGISNIEPYMSDQNISRILTGASLDDISELEPSSRSITPIKPVHKKDNKYVNYRWDEDLREYVKLEK